MRRLYVAVLCKGMYSPPHRLDPAQSCSLEASADKGQTEGHGDEKIGEWELSQAATLSMGVEGGGTDFGQGSEKTVVSCKDAGGARGALHAAGLYLSELERVCSELGRCNDMSAAGGGQVHGAARDSGDVRQESWANMAVSGEAVGKACRRLRELEVLAVFLCGVMLEVVRESIHAARGGVGGSGDAAQYMGGWWRGFGREQAVSMLERVGSCGESVLREGPEATGLSTLKTLLVHLIGILYTRIGVCALEEGDAMRTESDGERHASAARARETVARRRCAWVLVRALRADAAPALKLAVVDALTRACQCPEAVDRKAPGAIDSATVRELCHGALILASDADPEVRAAAAQCVQASILLAVAARQPAKALVGLRAALSRLADSCPASSRPPQHHQQQQTPLPVQATVADRYMEILGSVSHVLLLYPVRLISSKMLLDSMGEELGLPTWLRLLVAGKGGGGANVAAMRSVDLQRVMAFFAQRSQADMLSVLPRLFAISSSSTKTRGDGGGEKGTREVGTGVLECGEGLERAREDGGVGGRGGGRMLSAGRSLAEEGLMWAVVEASRLLIRSKLRSSFGGPVQTFEALEHMLLEACTRAEMDGHMLEKDTGVGGGGGGAQWHKALRMLLLFVGHLERLVFSAYEASVVLPPASVSSTKFFRANRKVCEDWFGRLRKVVLVYARTVCLCMCVCVYVCGVGGWVGVGLCVCVFDGKLLSYRRSRVPQPSHRRRTAF